MSQNRFGNVVQSVAMVLYTHDNEKIKKRLEEALESVGIVSDIRAYASWLDVSIRDIGKAFLGGRAGGILPCKSLWDINGSRLAAVLAFDSIAES